MTARTATRPTMTEGQAKSFQRFSVTSAVQIAGQLTCNCEPYADTFTFGRWIAQGFAVRKGEHGIRFSSYVPAESKADDDGEKTPFLLPRTLVVFCRHQVEAIPA